MSQNLLAAETSPYLLQHKDNPVHWRPWGEAALEEARAAGKPILLSVGYAACHWCHVMAHESFENEEVAAVMNELFVNIKVDREERPDIDTIYMSALQSLGEQGGWPLTMFLTPDGHPFWGGTYFPREAKYGRPGFTDVLREIHRIYRDENEKVTGNATAIAQALARTADPGPAATPTADVLDKVAERLVAHVDASNGGVGTAPKFPQPFLMELFWRAAMRSDDTRCRAATVHTLTHICQGGIYDHLGGGIARYSVDAIWLVPHFEKMLYDNASFIRLLTYVEPATGNPVFRQRLEETIAWTLREMTVEGGAFASSLDADTEGEEGKFYVWDKAEIDRALGKDADLFNHVYGVTPDGNFEGHTILNRLGSIEPLSAAQEETLARSREILFTLREKRTRPGRDDKVLADWNGLMIAALARAGAVYERADWMDAAVTAFDFIRTRMIVNGRLQHAFRAGKVQHLAMADDLANMIGAALALHEAGALPDALDAAEAFAAELDAHFWDPQGGGYFFTADDASALILRTRTVFDNATPAANGTMIEHLARLWHLTGKNAYRARADTLIETFASQLNENVFPMTSYLNGFDTLLNATQVTIVGGPGETARRDLASAAFRRAGPATVIQTISSPDALPATHPAHGKAVPADAAAAAFVCQGTACSLPVTAPEGLQTRMTQG